MKNAFPVIMKENEDEKITKAPTSPNERQWVLRCFFYFSSFLTKINIELIFRNFSSGSTFCTKLIELKFQTRINSHFIQYFRALFECLFNLFVTCALSCQIFQTLFVTNKINFQDNLALRYLLGIQFDWLNIKLRKYSIWNQQTAVEHTISDPFVIIEHIVRKTLVKRLQKHLN